MDDNQQDEEKKGGPSLRLVAGCLVGLPLTLWSYKVSRSRFTKLFYSHADNTCFCQCLMLIVFQRRIIYMNYFPPGSRSTKPSPSIHPELRDLDWSDVKVPSSDSVILRGLKLRRLKEGKTERQTLSVLYLQGQSTVYLFLTGSG